MPNLLAQGLRNLPKSAQEDLAGYVDPQTYANKLANQLRETTGQADYARWYQSRNPADLKAAKEKMVQTAIDWNPAGVGMTVWHGSPHKFDKFDMSKIGTGEGAQAYGHGLYFAESPEVAKGYQKALSAKDKDPMSIESLARRTVDGLNGDSQQAFRTLMDRYNSTGEGRFFDSAMLLKKDQNKITGSLYKTDIPDEAVARMLDWDKPLSEQAPEVQSAINKLASDYSGLGLNDLSQSVKNNETAEAFMRLYERQAGGAANASREAGKYGIPGIRYLDQGSRGTGQGTSNFVLFDDQMPRILEINGQPTGALPWSPSEWKFK